MRKPSSIIGEALAPMSAGGRAKDGIFLPRIQGVMDFFLPHAETNPDLADWMASHDKILARVFRAVASIYADDAVSQEKKILSMITLADDAWGPSRHLESACHSCAGIYCRRFLRAGGDAQGCIR